MGHFSALSGESAKKTGKRRIDIKRRFKTNWPKYVIFWPDLAGPDRPKFTTLSSYLMEIRPEDRPDSGVEDSAAGWIPAASPRIWVLAVLANRQSRYFGQVQNTYFLLLFNMNPGISWRKSRLAKCRESGILHGISLARNPRSRGISHS